MEWRLGRWIPVAWVIVLAALVTAPLLAPGFVLSYDLVFTPRQDLLPGALGLGGGLPRAVPQDAVVAILEFVIPGQLVEKLVLVGIPLLVGLGMLRLLRDQAPTARVVAAMLAIWNPFVAERLVLGHWGLLLAYAVAPWALASARDVRRGVPGAGPRLVLQIAAAGLTPTGSLMVTLLSVPIVVWPAAQTRARHRFALALAAVVTWLPWLIPTLLNPAATASDPVGADVFALRDEGWGVLITALGLGGAWNAEVVPESRQWPTAILLTVAVWAAAAWGFGALVTALGKAVALWWATCALGGLFMALASVAAPQPWSTLVEFVPGGGLLRDTHKLLAPLALLLAASAGLGLARLIGRIADRPTRLTVVAAAVLVPMALLPDLAWGVGGRLVPVDYPPAWAQTRQVLQADSRPGDVVVLPWSAFRRFDWNGNRTLLDPAPRWLPRTSIVDDGLAVETSEGVVVVEGEDPRAQAVAEMLTSGRPLSDLATLGIGWVLFEEQQGEAVPFSGLDEVPVGAGLRLFAMPGGVVAPASPAGAAVVAGADLLVVALLLVCAGYAVTARRRRDGRGTARPLLR